MSLEHYIIAALAALAAYLALVIYWRWYFRDCARPLPGTVAELLQDEALPERPSQDRNKQRERCGDCASGNTLPANRLPH